MNFTKKTIIFFLVFAIVANLSLGIFERKPRVSLRAELLMTQVRAYDSKIGSKATNSSSGSDAQKSTTDKNKNDTKDSGGSVAAACAVILTELTVGTSKGTGWGSNAICQAIQIARDAVKFVYEQLEKVWNKIEGTLRDIIAKRIMDYIVDQTVKWVQGGGKPKFISNWNRFLKDVGDIAFDSVAKDLELANLCSPFGLQLKLAFLPVPKFSERINCSLDQFVKNIQNFYVDFSVGGWEGYMLSWEMQNNFVGNLLIGGDEAIKQISEQTKAAESKAIANKGFLGVSRCQASKEEIGEQNKNLTEKQKAAGFGSTTGGGVSWDDMAATDGAWKCGGPSGNVDKDKARNQCLEDWKKDPGERGGIKARGKFEADVKKLGYQADSTGAYCKPENMKDVTPGDLVGESLANAIGSDSKWAANIQRWTSALVNAVINRLIEKGLTAMASSDTATPSRYYPPEYQLMANQQKLQDDLILINQIEPMQNEWNTLLTQKGNSLVYAREILTTLQQLQANNCTSTNGQLVTTADIDNASSTIDNLQLEVAFLQSNLDAAQSVIDQINSAQTDTEKTAASFALNNFMNTYNTIAFQTQIASGSERDAAKQQSADLLKQLEGEDVLDPVTNQLVNNGLRTRLSQCRAPVIP